MQKDPSVLVGYVYTQHKEYCRFLYPKTFNSLTYKNKLAAFIDEKDYPILRDQPTGEQRAAAGRQILIELARKKNVDWLFMLDLDTEPDPDCIEKLLAVKHAVVGGLHAARGDAWHIIGHKYKNRVNLQREWLKQSDVNQNQEVDGISGGTILVAKGIFDKVDYTGYIGPNTIPGRYTADDEWFLLNLYKKMKIRPHACFNCRSWHYHTDGRAYKLFGQQKIWRAY